MKKLLSLFLAIIMTFSMSAVAFAAEIGSVEEEISLSAKSCGDEEYFRFKPSTGRMSSTGEFEFYCNSYLLSDNFIAESNQITIEASAVMYNRNKKEPLKRNKKYTITVHKVGGSDLTPVLTGKLNGESVSTTVNVKKGEEYYLIIESSETLDAIYYMDGAGSVSPVTVLQ